MVNFTIITRNSNGTIENHLPKLDTTMVDSSGHKQKRPSNLIRPLSWGSGIKTLGKSTMGPHLRRKKGQASHSGVGDLSAGP